MAEEGGSEGQQGVTGGVQMRAKQRRFAIVVRNSTDERAPFSLPLSEPSSQPPHSHRFIYRLSVFRLLSGIIFITIIPTPSLALRSSWPPPNFHTM